MVTKPQAVIAVATTAIQAHQQMVEVTKPQAVIAVATGIPVVAIPSLRRSVTKPQAVIAVATITSCDVMLYITMVTKPQAVIAVATDDIITAISPVLSYKTASGNRCCNIFKMICTQFVNKLQNRKR